MRRRGISSQVGKDRAWIASRLRWTACSPLVRRYVTAIDQAEIPELLKPWLSALVLVESSARPAWFRSLEWVVFMAGRLPLVSSVGGERLRRLSVGPLQIRNGPWSFEQALRVAARRLAALNELTARSVAVAWHGAWEREPGARVGYEDALEAALQILGRPSNRDR